MEDIGDTHLQTIIREKNDPNYTRALYQKVLDALIRSMPGTEDSREVVSLLNDRVEQLKMFKSWVDELIRQQKAA